VRNDVTASGITGAFAGWVIERMTPGALRSDTRAMQALVVRLRRE
jgi:hypothetical protein